jgi:hypothetical protein
VGKGPDGLRDAQRTGRLADYLRLLTLWSYSDLERRYLDILLEPNVDVGDLLSPEKWSYFVLKFLWLFWCKCMVIPSRQCFACCSCKCYICLFQYGFNRCILSSANFSGRHAHNCVLSFSNSCYFTPMGVRHSPQTNHLSNTGIAQSPLNRWRGCINESPQCRRMTCNLSANELLLRREIGPV